MLYRLAEIGPEVSLEGFLPTSPSRPKVIAISAVSVIAVSVNAISVIAISVSRSSPSPSSPSTSDVFLPEVRIFVPSGPRACASAQNAASKLGFPPNCRRVDHDAWRVHPASEEFASAGLGLPIAATAQVTLWTPCVRFQGQEVLLLRA